MDLDVKITELETKIDSFKDIMSETDYTNRDRLIRLRKYLVYIKARNAERMDELNRRELKK